MHRRILALLATIMITATFALACGAGGDSGLLITARQYEISTPDGRVIHCLQVSRNDKGGVAVTCDWDHPLPR